MLMLLEDLQSGLQIFCAKLKWPAGSCDEPRAKDGLAADAHHYQVRPRGADGHARGAPHHGAQAILDHFGFDRHALSAIVDAAQASTELYYYVRELNRAMHLGLGLPPPTTRVFPRELEDAFV